MSKDIEDLVFKEWQTPNTYDEKYSPLPELPGVYVFAERIFCFGNRTEIKQTIYYVGSAGNLLKRCEHHPIKNKMREYGMDIACYFKPCDNYREEEKRLIKLTQARWNKQWR